LRSEVNFTVTYGYEPHVWQDYIENHFNANPFNPVAFRSSAGDVLSRAGYTAELWQKFVDSDVYRKWAGPLGVVDIVQGTLDKTLSGIALISCARHQSVGIATEAEIRRMGLLLPHLRRAILISKALDLRTVQAAAFEQTIDGLASGVFLVSPQGELVHANTIGLSMLDAGDLLKLERGALVSPEATAQAALRKAFEETMHGDVAIEGSGMALPLATAAGGRFIAHVLPLTSGRRLSAGAYYSASAALFVRAANVDLAAAINAASTLYGLTPAEERVARAVVEMGNVPAVASLLGSSPSTVKKHLEHIFEKTGTRRQTELFKLVAGFDSPARGHAKNA
jgi:DNA-binding CsgD family transcriptional regulator